MPEGTRLTLADIKRSNVERKAARRKVMEVITYK